MNVDSIKKALSNLTSTEDPGEAVLISREQKKHKKQTQETLICFSELWDDNTC